MLKSPRRSFNKTCSSQYIFLLKRIPDYIKTWKYMYEKKIQHMNNYISFCGTYISIHGYQRFWEGNLNIQIRHMHHKEHNFTGCYFNMGHNMNRCTILAICMCACEGGGEAGLLDN